MKQIVRYRFMTIPNKLNGEIKISVDDRGAEYATSYEAGKSTTIGIFPIISIIIARQIEIDDTGKRTRPAWNINDSLGLTKFTLPVFVRELKGIEKDLQTIMPKLKDLVDRGYSIAVFPEGTRSGDCKIQRFHKGAFHIAAELGLDVIPMCLYGAGRVLPKTGKWLRKGRIHIDAAAPYSRASLDAVGGEIAQASYARARCQESYERISDKIDQYV